ncbi:MAG: PD-(D/E)XK nuclease family protein, partial [Terrimicrobiaceae bacterium]|nr:PD-(D/E)XK nuclease family protein [Terrimicrobiaceae bacterium]
LPAAKRLPPPSFVRVTDFSNYLACPLRFYFSRVLGEEAFDPRTRELDAMAFGSLLHGAIENFSRKSPGEKKAARIAAAVIAELEELVARRFGRLPAPPIRIQIESAKVRLRAFAEIQA